MPNLPPLTFNSPSVKFREVDFSGYSLGPGASTLGIIGVFERGPIATPTIVHSFPEAQRTFGNFLPSYYSMYALKQFFDNGGAQANVLRTAHYTTITDATTLTAVKASFTFQDASSVNTLLVSAFSEGTWANGATGGISVQVLTGTVNPTTDFRLDVFFNGSKVESFDNLSVSSQSQYFVETVVNGNSAYITATFLSAGTRPAVIAATNLTGGDDGLTSLADTDFTGDTNARTGFSAWDGQKGISFIAAPGRTGSTMASGLIAYAESRKDLFAILETPSGLSLTNAIAFRNQTTPYSGAAFDSSYAGLYYPWVKFADPVTGLVRLFPPSGAVAGLFAANDAVANVWGAPAGYNRGLLKQCAGLETDITETQADILFPAGVNPITREDGVGFVVMGQLTLQRLPSATDRIGTRRLLIYIEQTARLYAKSLLFEPDSTTTWNAMKRFLDQFLGTIKSNQGLYDYFTVIDSSNNPPDSIAQNRMNVDIFVKPTKYAEFITLNVMITDTSVSFKDLFQQN